MSSGFRCRLPFMGAVSPGRVVVDVSALAPNAASLDALATLQLALRRRGLDARLRGAPRELLELIAFAGLATVLRVEARREAEEREERLGVQEEGELDDPPAL
jgi:hypothetical protein